MAELTTTDETTANSCCEPEAQATAASRAPRPTAAAPATARAAPARFGSKMFPLCSRVVAEPAVGTFAGLQPLVPERRALAGGFALAARTCILVHPATTYGGGRIRTCEGRANAFTARPL